MDVSLITKLRDPPDFQRHNKSTRKSRLAKMRQKNFAELFVRNLVITPGVLIATKRVGLVELDLGARYNGVVESTVVGYPIYSDRGTEGCGFGRGGSGRGCGSSSTGNMSSHRPTKCVGLIKIDIGARLHGAVNGSGDGF